MPGSYLNRSWEVSSVPAGTSPGGAGKGNRNSAIHADEKSDIPIVPKNSQRKDLERLCRYITRPAIANERLKRDGAGDVVLQLKSA